MCVCILVTRDLEGTHNDLMAVFLTDVVHPVNSGDFSSPKSTVVAISVGRRSIGTVEQRGWGLSRW